MTIEATTSKIMALLPTEQMRLQGAATLRQQIHQILLTHSGQLQDKINDLDRRLYISSIKVENAREEEVDSAGFNK
jgi:hypothetical protein